MAPTLGLGHAWVPMEAWEGAVFVCIVRSPPTRGLQNDRVCAVATPALPSVGPVSHPNPALSRRCEFEGGTLLGKGTRQDTGALSTLDRRPLCSKQEIR